MNKWIITPRQRCDLEMLLVNGFSPLDGFLTQSDYEQVVLYSRLANGRLWPIPVTLDVNAEFAEKVELGSEIGLYETDNTLVATMTVTDKWQPDKNVEALTVFGTNDIKHPAVHYLLHKAHNWYLGGKVKLIKSIVHHDFAEMRMTPDELQKLFKQKNWDYVVGFQTRNPIHRAHLELMLRAADQVKGHVLIHPVVGMTKPGDVDYFTRVRCYQKILPYFPNNKAMLSLLPLAMRMGGPREALWHAIIRKNYGCTHFIVGRDHAGPGNDSQGKPFYDPYAAQECVKVHQDEIGIKMIPFQEMVYVKERNKYCTQDEVQPSETALNISGTQLRDALLYAKPIPEWFSFPDVIEELRASYLPKHKHGLTLFFTGLSGAGKTTIAQALIAKLMSLGKRNITQLDGDVVRRVLATELGFSRADRDLNIRRIGFVAAEVTKAGGTVICAAIAPYNEVRNEIRDAISQHGGYLEIYVSTSLEVCERRDTKGLYAKARNNELQGFTGVNDPYEAPATPDIELDTAVLAVEDCVNTIINYLVKNDHIRHEMSDEKSYEFVGTSNPSIIPQ